VSPKFELLSTGQKTNGNSGNKPSDLCPGVDGDSSYSEKLDDAARIPNKAMHDT
jgi:hypothetical protein